MTFLQETHISVHTSVRRALTWLACMLAVSLPLPLGAQTTVEDGLLEISPSPEYGFPGVSFDSTPLWSVDTPGTSSVFLRIEGRVVELRGDSRSIFSEIQESGDAFVQQWETSGVKAQLTIERVYSIGNVTLSDDDSVVALRMGMRLSNESRRPLELGVRYLIDTWFGERNQAHFSTGVADADRSRQVGVDENGDSAAQGSDSGQGVSVEDTMSIDDRYIESAGPRGALRLRLTESTEPDQVSVANTRRLKEAAWFYNTGRARGFSLRPFSVNDSALHIVFDTVTVDPESERSVELLFLAAGDREDIVAAMTGGAEQTAQAEASREEPRERDTDRSQPSDTEATEDEQVSEESEPSSEQEAIDELDDALIRLQEISDGERDPEPGELEEIQDTIERLRDLRDTL